MPNAIVAGARPASQYLGSNSFEHLATRTIDRGSGLSDLGTIEESESRPAARVFRRIDWI